MAYYKILSDTLKAIADAIRGKTGTTAQIAPGDMPTKIAGIETGITPSGIMTITENGTYSVFDYANAEVSVPISGFSLQTKEIVITENGTYEYTPDSGYDGLSKIVFVVNVASGGVRLLTADGYALTDANGFHVTTKEE